MGAIMISFVRSLALSSSLRTDFAVSLCLLRAEELDHAADDILVGLLQAEGVGASSARLPGPMSGRPAGHRVLPVFVLSLLGMPPGLLLDKQFLQVASVTV